MPPINNIYLNAATGDLQTLSAVLIAQNIIARIRFNAE